MEMEKIYLQGSDDGVTFELTDLFDFFHRVYVNKIHYFFADSHLFPSFGFLRSTQLSLQDNYLHRN
jgi:hypothetical protein